MMKHNILNVKYSILDAYQGIDNFLKDLEYDLDKESLFKELGWISKEYILETYNQNERVQELFTEDDDAHILNYLAKTTDHLSILEKLSKITNISFSKISCRQYELNKLYWSIYWNPVCTEEIQKSLITDDSGIFVRDIILDDRTSTSILEYITDTLPNMISCLFIPRHQNVNLSILDKLSKSDRWATRREVIRCSLCTDEIAESLKNDSYYPIQAALAEYYAKKRKQT